MDTEQCIQMMKELSNVYRRISESNSVSSEKKNILKHTLTELELSMITMRICVEKLYSKKKDDSTKLKEIDLNDINCKDSN